MWPADDARPVVLQISSSSLSLYKEKFICRMEIKQVPWDKVPGLAEAPVFALD
jgi:hypothetical protein